MTKSYIFKLDNGINVFYVQRPTTTGLCFAQLNFKNGYIYENPNQLDYTHIGEHLFAMYTSTKHPDHRQIINMLGKKGVEQNAYTSIFDTGYHFQGRSKDLVVFLTLFFQMMYDYKFTADWEKQKNIVLEELKMRSSEAFNDLQELEDRVVYGKQHRLGCSSKETIKVVEIATLEDVLDYNRKFMRTTHCLLSIEADLEMSQLRSLLNRMVGNWASVWSHFSNNQVTARPYPKLPSTPSTPPISKTQIYDIGIPNIQSAKIVFYFQHPWIQFDVIPEIETNQTLNYFCRGYFSKLFQRLREDLGLVYGVSSEQYFPPNRAIPGFVKIVMNIDAENINKAIPVVRREITQLQSHLIDDDNFQRIKNENKIEYAEMQLTNPIGKYIHLYSSYVLWGQKPVSIRRYYKLAAQVTKEQILKRAQQLFDLDKMLIFIGRPK